MIRRTTGYLGIDPAEPKISQIKLVDKYIDHANRIVLDNPIFQALRKQRALPTINPFNEALHPIPRKSSGNHIARSFEARRFHTTRVNRVIGSGGR